MSEINNNIEKKTYKVAILASHPIQYQTPFFKELAKQENIDLKVFFCSDFGLRTYKDKDFGKELKWDIPLLEGYKYEFLPNISPVPSIFNFFGLINPGIIDNIKDGNFDAVWVHGWTHCTNWLAMLAAFRNNIPVLLRGESNLLNKTPLYKRILKSVLLPWFFKN